jgi:hypothetical protein
LATHPRIFFKDLTSSWRTRRFIAGNGLSREIDFLSIGEEVIATDVTQDVLHALIEIYLIDRLAYIDRNV